MTRALLVALLAAALGCNHEISRPDGGADAGDAGGIPDGGTADAGAIDSGPRTVQVRAVFPAHGPAAGGTAALVSGSGFVEGFAVRGGAATSQQTTVTVGGARATGVDVIDDNRLQIVTPAGAGGAADVVVTNPNGAGRCAGCFRFQAALEVTAIEPATGPSSGGTPVTVRGKGFAGGMLLLVGGRGLITLTVVDAQTATGISPPGASGGADVLALTADSAGELRRGFIYTDALAVESVEPAVGPPAGGTRLTISGRGFSAQAVALIDGVPVPTFWADAEHLIAIAPAHAAGAADATVIDATVATLPRGYVYAAPGALLLGSVAPRRGPVEGGTCPQACLTLVGSGFSTPDVIVSIAGADVPARVQGDTRLEVDLPAAAAPGPVEIAVRSASASSAIPAADPGAFHYQAALAISSIAPPRGPSIGGTALAISGLGFGAAAEVRIGALPATAVVVAADGRSISAISPPGSPGPADVVVIDQDRTARLAGSFFYEAPLKLAQVDPASGSQSGGARVTLWGQGFETGLVVAFGGKPVTGVAVLSPSMATALVPSGDPGAVEVAVTRGAERSAVRDAFTYFDPSSTQGGTTGGPLRGTLNVTVLDASAFAQGGVQDALVDVRLAGGRRIQGLTDARGQLTFSDDELVLPCAVTISKAQYSAITVADVQIEDLSVYIAGPPKPPPPPPDTPPPTPTPQQPASVSGRVLGFKVPPGLQLGPSQRLAAYVAVARSSVYSAPPFAQQPRYLVVTEDGGRYALNNLTRLSPTTVYALFGIEERSTVPPGFEPLLLGIRRGVVPDPDKPVTDADVILDTHLDQTVDVAVLGVPSTPRGPVAHDAAVSLDLGTAGVIPLGRVVQSQPLDSLRFAHLPAASGQGFVFVDIVGLWTGSVVTTPATTYLRRIFSDPGPGLTLGPLLPFPVITAPIDGAQYAGALRWTLAGALQPNLVQVQVNGSTFSWGAVLPGSARELVPSPQVAARLAPGSYVWSVTASESPAFDYAHWAYSDLFSGSWTAFSFDVVSFEVRP